MKLNIFASNGLKKRDGHQMENLVEKYIVAAGLVKEQTYFKEMYLKDIEKSGILIYLHFPIKVKLQKDLILS